MAAAEQGERNFQAQAYVEGRMSPAEREAAEHLLEVDGDFRLAVVEAAERLGLLPRTDFPPADGWDGVRRNLAALPHMQDFPGRLAVEPTPPPARHARRQPARAWLAWLNRLLARLSLRRR